MPDDDLVLPFRTVQSDVIGRVIVRLGSVVDTVLSRHAYPEPVSHALGEALALTAMLGSALKTDGQAHPADQDRRPARFPGRRLRGARQGARLCQLRQDRCRAGRGQGPRRSGRAARQGPRRHDHRSAAATRTATRASSRSSASRWSMPPTPISASPSSCRPSSAWRWRATTGRADGGGERGLALARRRPDDPAAAARGRQAPRTRPRCEPEDDDEENWNRARHLAATVEDHELLDPHAVARAPALPAVPRGGRAGDAGDRACRRMPLLARAHPRATCSRFGADELEDMREPDGGLTVTCEFCSRKYRFAPDQIA